MPFQMLTALPLTAEQWAAIARKAGWQMLRMNLNTFARHGVFEEKGFARHVAERLRTSEEIKRAKVFPYQLMVAYTMAGKEVPAQGARGAAGRDGNRDRQCAADRRPRGGVPGRVRLDEVAGDGLPQGGDLGGALHRRGGAGGGGVHAGEPGTRVIPFEQHVVNLRLNPRDSVMTNAASSRPSAAVEPTARRRSRC